MKQKGRIIHGGNKNGIRTSEYVTWGAMKGRCHSPNHQNFKYYGGRGIVVCERWMNSFSNFLADIGKKPTPAHTLDRIDTNGNYEPGNVRWATRKEQANNIRRNRRLTANGETHNISQWAIIKGIDGQTLWSRINSGWDPERAVNTPAKFQNRKIIK